MGQTGLEERKTRWKAVVAASVGKEGLKWSLRGVDEDKFKKYLKPAVNTISSEGKKIQLVENLKRSGLGAREGDW